MRGPSVAAREPAPTPDLDALESADAVLILGEDVTQTAPRMALGLRQSVRNKAYEMAADLKLQPWQDAAIRNLAQDQRSPLFIASVADTRLDDVATARVSLWPLPRSERSDLLSPRDCRIANMRLPTRR
jgi:NADH-quinone oxidoreductase subunit G